MRRLSLFLWYAYIGSRLQALLQWVPRYNQQISLLSKSYDNTSIKKFQLPRVPTLANKTGIFLRLISHRCRAWIQNVHALHAFKKHVTYSLYVSPEEALTLSLKHMGTTEVIQWWIQDFPRG